jgi:beta-glucosidase
MKKLFLVFTLCTFLVPNTFSQKAESQYTGKNIEVPIYLNTSYTFEERATDIVSRLTIAEKQSLLGNTMPAIPRLGINAYQVWGEALHGLAGFLTPNVKTATSFPGSMAISSSWDTELMEREASAISEEGRGTNTPVIQNLTYWSPVVEPVRDPRWGRTGESFGEDPFLISRIAGAFIRGMMGNDPVYIKAVPTAKHFFANNSEFNRHSGSSDMDERDMREFYLAPYKSLIEKDKLPSIMTSYNAVNGVPVSASKYFVDTLIRKIYGLKGYITGDCGAIADIETSHFYSKDSKEAAAMGLKAGVDCDCGNVYQSVTVDALKAGLVSEAEIDKALVNLFAMRMRMGEFDPYSKVPYSGIQPNVVNSKGNTVLATAAATKTPVLLKNSIIKGTEKKALPLNAAELKRIAVIGPKANVVELGPYSGSPEKENLITPLNGLKSLIAAKGSSAEVVFSSGANTLNSTNLFSLFSFETIGTDGSATKYDAIKYIDSSEGIVVASSVSSEKVIKNINDGSWIAFSKINISDVKSINLKLTVNSDGGSVEVRTGSVSGNMLATFEIPASSGTLSSMMSKTVTTKANQLGVTGEQTLYFVFHAPAMTPIDPESIALAGKSDAAIVFVGTDDKTASEESDRQTILLPGNQVELIKAVSAVNPNTIVVIQSLGMVEMEEIKNLPGVAAIIWTGYNGQAQGTAIASILFGDVNPGGKLNATWYKSLKDLPPITDYNLRPSSNNPGRTYWYFTKDVSYEFGYGLSYTTFEYSNFGISKPAITPNDRINISADIKNSGTCQGDEVVQVYLKTVDSPASLQRPTKRLKGFLRVTIPAGQTKTVTIPIDCSELWFWNPETKKLTFDQGKYIFEIGSSSNDIRGSVEAVMNGTFITALKTVVAECNKVVIKRGDIVHTRVTAALSDDSFLDIKKAGIRYKSNNPDVASVDETGAVTAKSGGVASIEAFVTFEDRTLSGSYTVKVMPSLYLKSISVSGKKINGFNPDINCYSYILMKANSKVPQVEAVIADAGTGAEIVQAKNVPGTASILLKNKNTGDTKLYTVNFGLKSLSDEFNNTSIGGQWSWIRENRNNWSLTNSTGSLSITSKPGDVRGSSNNAENIFLQNANTDWTIESKVKFSRLPSKSRQQGGIIAYQDDDNFVKLVCDYNSGDQVCFDLLVEENGIEYPAARLRVSELLNNNLTVVFRMIRKGNNYTAMYSSDGNNFKIMGSTEAVLNGAKAGLITCNGAPDNNIFSMLLQMQEKKDDSEFVVMYDYFRIVNSGLKE